MITRARRQSDRGERYAGNDVQRESIASRYAGMARSPCRCGSSKRARVIVVASTETVSVRSEREMAMFCYV